MKLTTLENIIVGYMVRSQSPRPLKDLRETMRKGPSCRVRYVWKGESWEEFKTWKEAKKLARKVIKKFVFDTPKKFLDEQSESMGLWMKRHGITREKVNKIQEKKEFKLARKQHLDDVNLASLRDKWDPIIDALNKTGSVTFTKHDHKGKARGRDIGIMAHRDLQKLGIETRVKFTKDRGIILELKK